MRSPAEITRFLLGELARLRQKRVLAGFDGFIDTIAKPVRGGGVSGGHEYFRSIEEFGAYIGGHSHKSLSLQYDVLERRAGGNMPNFVKALDALSLHITAVGMLSAETAGDTTTDPLFAGLGVERYSYLAAGSSTAFEFEDGKIFLSSAGLPPALQGRRALTLIEKVYPEFCAAAAHADLVAFLNWSELPFAQDLWDDIYARSLYAAGNDKSRFAFFDLCDTGAKSRTELERVFLLIGKIRERRTTILSLNKNEALDIHQKLGGERGSPAEIAETLRKTAGVDELIIHQHTESLTAMQEGLVRELCVLNKKPRISTGAGDHFNAAYCFTSLAGLPVVERLRFANAYAAVYIASGVSPRLGDREIG